MPANAAENVLGKIQVQLAVSRRLALDQSWRYDLLSPFWRLYVNNRAGAWLIHAGKKIPLRADLAYLIPAWIRFQCAARGPLVQDFLHFYVIGPPPTLLRRLFGRPLLLPRDPVLEGLCRRWRTGLKAVPGLASFGWATALAQAAVALAADHLSKESQRLFTLSLVEYQRIGPALVCIDQRLAHPPGNAELSRLCGLSIDYFIREFHQIVGLTPAKYGLERRVALAARSLTAGHDTIEKIAADSGFTDRFHFSRVFKSRLGQPPVAYRRLHRISRRVETTTVTGHSTDLSTLAKARG
jgi:AraC-like DNA-binding protein